MTDFPYISGVDVGTISNKEFARFETTKASDIVIALDKSGIPFSARFGDSEIVLTYDGSYKEEVEEILAKVSSGDYEALLREIREKKDDNGYLILLSEVADVLNTPVGTLKARPVDLQEMLCKTYVDFWLCDTYTIQRELDRILTVNGRTLSDMQEHELRDYQANNTPEKREKVELDDAAHQMSVIRNAEDHRMKAEQMANETARTAYITREMRRKNAEELRRKQAENKRIPQRDERERTKRP